MALKYRTTDDSDLNRLNEWTSKDPFHKDTLTGGYWLQPFDKDGNRLSGITCITVENEFGKPLFYLRLENVVRAMIQFPPDADPNMTDYLKETFCFVASNAKAIGYQEMIFDSVSKPLVHFFHSLGFRPMENHYKVTL